MAHEHEMSSSVLESNRKVKEPGTAV